MTWMGRRRRACSHRPPWTQGRNNLVAINGRRLETPAAICDGLSPCFADRERRAGGAVCIIGMASSAPVRATSHEAGESSIHHSRWGEAIRTAEDLLSHEPRMHLAQRSARLFACAVGVKQAPPVARH